MSNPVSDNSTTTGSIPTQSEIAQIRAARAAEAKLVDQINDAYESGELTAGDFEAVLRDIVLTKLPAGYTLGPCPPWCMTDHAGMDDFERTEGFVEHRSQVVEVPATNTKATNRSAWVVVAVVDELDDGVRHGAEVDVWMADSMTAKNARLLAAAIERAAAVAEAWNAEVSGR